MKIIDRYVVKQFVQTIFFALLAFIAIFVIVDLMENLDDFLDQNVATPIIFQYYLYFIPEIVKLITPVAVLFAGLFTVGKMSNVNELTAIKASGMNLYRFMFPLVIVSFLVSLFSIYFGGYVVPKANKAKLAIEINYLKKGYFFSGSNIFFQDTKNKIVNISFYDETNLIAHRVSVQEFEKNDITKMKSRMDAQQLVFDSTKNMWIAKVGSFRAFGNLSDTLENFLQKEMPSLQFKPNELAFKQQKPEEMNLGELRTLIADKKKAGNDPTSVMIEYYSRYSFAMASLVVVLFGMPLSANKRKGGLALQFGINILITFIYLGLMKIIEAFGKNGALDPVLTAWLVNIFFFIGSLINLSRVKQ